MLPEFVQTKRIRYEQQDHDYDIGLTRKCHKRLKKMNNNDFLLPSIMTNPFNIVLVSSAVTMLNSSFGMKMQFLSFSLGLLGTAAKTMLEQADPTHKDIKELIMLMYKYSSLNTVQGTCIARLKHLDLKHGLKIESLGSLDVIINAMNNHDDIDIHANGCELIYSFIRENNVNDQYLPKIKKAILRTMIQCNKPTIQEHGIKILHVLVSCNAFKSKLITCNDKQMKCNIVKHERKIKVERKRKNKVVGERESEISAVANVVMKSILDNTQDQTIQQFGLATLAKLAKFEKDSIVKSGGIQIAIETMKNHSDVMTIKNQCVELVYGLIISNNDNKNLFVSLGGIAVMVNEMNAHNVASFQKFALEDLNTKDLINQMDQIALIEFFQEKCCRVICLMMSCDTSRIEIERVGGIESVMNSMKQHSSVVNIQVVGCEILGSFPNNQNGEYKERIEAIIYTMNKNKFETSIQAKGCNAISSLAENDSCKELIEKLGGFDILSEELKLHVSKNDIVNNALSALFLLTFNYENKAKLANTVDAVDNILSLMKCHDKNQESIHLYGSGIISNLASGNEATRLQVANLGGIEALLSTLNMNFTASGRRKDVIGYSLMGIRRNVCRGLYGLALSADNHEKIINHGGIESIIKAMDHEDVQGKGCAILRSLTSIDNGVRKKVVEAGGIRTFLTVIRNHHSTTQAVIDGFIALYNLAQNHEIRIKITETDAATVALETLSRYESDHRVQKHGNDALDMFNFSFV
jgi:hypothetical protein